jgi:hypothetical protein
MVTAICRSVERWRPWFTAELVSLALVAALGRAASAFAVVALVAAVAVAAAAQPFRQVDRAQPRGAGALDVR